MILIEIIYNISFLNHALKTMNIIGYTWGKKVIKNKVLFLQKADALCQWTEMREMCMTLCI